MLKDLKSAEIYGKNVLIRIDADVSISENVVTDAERIQASIPTIKYLLENGAKVTIVGHIGRPNGKEVLELKIRPVEDKLIELLGSHSNWQILENLRFNPGEEGNDPEYAKQLAAGQDLFVQDAFAVCHRKHASTLGVKEILPTYAGFSVQREVENLTLLAMARNITIIIGGKKAEDKLPVIGNLSDKAKVFLIGGVVANTFLSRRGLRLGKSLVEEKVFPETDKISKEEKDKLNLPLDLLISKSLKEPEDIKTIDLSKIPSNNLGDYYAVDIGKATIDHFQELIAQADVIFFNGNMGVTEVEAFSHGTLEIAQAIVASRAKKYAGGGDTTTFLRTHGLAQKFDFISNGGGATLEFLSGKSLPGL